MKWYNNTKSVVRSVFHAALGLARENMAYIEAGRWDPATGKEVPDQDRVPLTSRDEISKYVLPIFLVRLTNSTPGLFVN